MILSKTLAILFSGKAGVGKSRSAAYVVDYLSKTYNLEGYINPFAFGVKELAKKGYGWDGVKDTKGRKLLQDIGRIGREYNENIWVDKALQRFYSGETVFPKDFVIFDDWRFPNELIRLQKEPGFHIMTVRIESPEREILKGIKEYDDISENALPSVNFEEKLPEYYEHAINNTSSLDDLYSTLEYILDNEIEEIKFK
jgi:hypothetical protein